MQGNFVEISFQAKFLQKATKSQEFRRNSFALLLHNTVCEGYDFEEKGVFSNHDSLTSKMENLDRHEVYMENVNRNVKNLSLISFESGLLLYYYFVFSDLLFPHSQNCSKLVVLVANSKTQVFWTVT